MAPNMRHVSCEGMQHVSRARRFRWGPNMLQISCKGMQQATFSGRSHGTQHAARQLRGHASRQPHQEIEIGTQNAASQLRGYVAGHLRQEISWQIGSASSRARAWSSAAALGVKK